jgi:hypothetical protein
MNVYAYLALIVVIIGFFVFLYRSGYKNGYKKGRDDADIEWQKKVNNTLDRMSDHADPGFSVSDTGARWGEAADAEKRLEPDHKDEGQ